MTQKTPSLNEFSGVNWQILGEIELPVGATTSALIQTWLVETLRPLDLNARFLEKILASANLSVERDIHPADGQQSEHVHVLIFTPVKSPSIGQSWGFFRVEKKGDLPAANNISDHAIAFYLYLEGK